MKSLEIGGLNADVLNQLIVVKDSEFLDKVDEIVRHVDYFIDKCGNVINEENQMHLVETMVLVIEDTNMEYEQYNEDSNVLYQMVRKYIVGAIDKFFFKYAIGCFVDEYTGYSAKKVVENTFTKEQILKFVDMRNSSEFRTNLQFLLDADECGIDVDSLGDPIKIEHGYKWVTEYGQLIEELGFMKFIEKD